MYKPYNLEERTLLFAKNCRIFMNRLPKSPTNFEDIKQLARSSGSIGANYIEANENLGSKDFKMHLKISRKEAKESGYWLTLLQELNPEFKEYSTELISESHELRKIFSKLISR